MNILSMSMWKQEMWDFDDYLIVPSSWDTLHRGDGPVFRFTVLEFEWHRFLFFYLFSTPKVYLHQVCCMLLYVHEQMYVFFKSSIELSGCDTQESRFWFSVLV